MKLNRRKFVGLSALFPFLAKPGLKKLKDDSFPRVGEPYKNDGIISSITYTFPADKYATCSIGMFNEDGEYVIHNVPIR